MENFKRNSYASHGFSKIELFVIVLAITLVVFIVIPKFKSMVLNIKINSAIESVNSYKESVNNYYMSQLLIDSNFKLDGVYTISDGNLIATDAVYNIRMVGNVPSQGYLDYENNYLKNGCVIIDGYSINVVDGKISSVTDSCELDILEPTDVALNM